MCSLPYAKRLQSVCFPLGVVLSDNQDAGTFLVLSFDSSSVWICVFVCAVCEQLGGNVSKSCNGATHHTGVGTNSSYLSMSLFSS